MEFLNKLLNIYKDKPAPINGAIAGLIFSVSILFLGFFQTLFVVGCVIVGYVLGKLLSENKEFLINLLERILPPGRF